YLPYAAFKGKFRRDFILRLGFLSKDIEFDSPIWLHAVSVGEILASRPLLTKIRENYPHRQIVISTITETANRIAQDLAQRKDFVFYLPLDLSFIVKRVIRRIKPCLCIVMETEIWPNLISGLNRERVPVVMVNARISDKSYKRYRLIRFLLRPLLNKITLFCAQTKADQERFICLGADKDKVKITGNMKFDMPRPQTAPEKPELGLGALDRLLVAGSTHAGEEKIILDIYKELLIDFPHLKLLIAPRHPERTREIERLVEAYNFRPLLISKLPTTNSQPRTKCIFILDTIGGLSSFYALASVVFVGGSLVKRGGHNVIEPAYFKKAIIVGPYTFNFKDIVNCFLNGNGILCVNNKQELKENLKLLLIDEIKRRTLGANAYDIIQANQGASQKNLAYIHNLLS
ncbi:MAG: 3-deoxy-D-manno-octulosonic acid transferase, partial [Candidatus Omnitrophica bacterium]|nr:3-deoxy-D-manno-octulosonic acid transferase [Candidatus Omnitrophota bacterium]